MHPRPQGPNGNSGLCGSNFNAILSIDNMTLRTCTRFIAASGLLLTAVAAAQPSRSTIRVRAGDDLQQAIERARPGDTLALEPGATYVGNFVLPLKDGKQHITITTVGEGLPAEGARVTPAHAPRLAKLKSPNKEPVLRTAERAHHWRLQLLEFLPTEAGHGDIIALGDGGAKQTTRA